MNFYVGAANKIDPDGVLLTGLDAGKGCIRFRKSRAVADTRIEEFIEKAMTMLRNGEDIGCDSKRPGWQMLGAAARKGARGASMAFGIRQ